MSVELFPAWDEPGNKLWEAWISMAGQTPGAFAGPAGIDSMPQTQATGMDFGSGGLDLSSLFGANIGDSGGQQNNDLFNLLLGLGLSQKGQGQDNLNTLFSGIEV